MDDKMSHHHQQAHRVGYFHYRGETLVYIMKHQIIWKRFDDLYLHSISASTRILIPLNFSFKNNNSMYHMRFIFVFSTAHQSRGNVYKYLLNK